MQDYRIPTLDMIRAIAGSMEKWLKLSNSSNRAIANQYSQMCALCDYDMIVRGKAKRANNTSIIVNSPCGGCPVDMVSGGSCDNTPWGDIDFEFNQRVGFSKTEYADFMEGPTRLSLLAEKEYQFLVKLFDYAVHCYQNQEPITSAGYNKFTYPSEFTHPSAC